MTTPPRRTPTSAATAAMTIVASRPCRTGSGVLPSCACGEVIARLGRSTRGTEPGPTCLVMCEPSGPGTRACEGTVDLFRLVRAAALDEDSLDAHDHGSLFAVADLGVHGAGATHH